VTEPDQRRYVDCAVIIVTYNSAGDIAGLLDSLPAAGDGLTLRVIVVDNGSADDTLGRVRNYPEVVCVAAGANLGYAGGINVGRQHAGQCGALAVLNPDLILEPGALREMFAALKDTDVGLVVPMLLDPEGHLFPSLRREPTVASAIGDAIFGRHFGSRPAWLSGIVRDRREYEYRHPVDWAGGAAMFISRRLTTRPGSVPLASAWSTCRRHRPVIGGRGLASRLRSMRSWRSIACGTSRSTASLPGLCAPQCSCMS
jgi:GT2 family glycosyltransferase